MHSIKSKITHNIINAAIEVYNELAYGFLESTYRDSLKIELTLRGYNVETEKKLNVFYKKHLVGINYADIIADDVLIEIKTCKRLISAHYKQLQHYMKVTDIDTGLIFNFGPDKLDWHRVFPG